MLENARLKEIIEQYKQNFNEVHWENEKHKWQAVKCFQDNWDVNHADFADMLSRALAKTGNLLASTNNFPAKMLQDFAKAAPEEVRASMIALFDEDIDYFRRIEQFKQSADRLLQRYGNGNKMHYQNENAISTYLWLRFPNKCYIYKFNEVKMIANKLASNYSFKKGSYAENIHNFLNLYDEIRVELQKDAELVQLVQMHLTNDCFPDPSLCTLTIDVGFSISRRFDEWEPKDYTPGLSIEEWIELLQNQMIFHTNSIQIMQRLLDIGGEATCTQLSKKYGETKNFYNVGSSSLAQRIAEKTGCHAFENSDGTISWWPILYVGKKAGKDDTGSYIWKLRDELREALEQVNLNNLLNPLNSEPNYWWLNANPNMWSFSNIAIGENQCYTFINENGNKRRVYQNFLDAKVGDMVIGYESNPVKQIVALGKICGVQNEKNLYFEKIESLTTPLDYSYLKNFAELATMEYFISPYGTLFKLTKDEYEFIYELIREANPIESMPFEPYSKQNFLNEVFMTDEKYDSLISVLANKKNIILQGAPGVGKTFAARRLAYSIMGEVDDNRIGFVQFHQNYSYEDFMMGYKPVEGGFELKYGIFHQFCLKAANSPDKDFYFIIDEINRGNMSKIFGELLMLIERGYRGTKATLAYNGMSFTVPENVHLIGMMNTADRSLAMIDYALRRRFSFISMEPGFDTAGFIQYQNRLANDTFNELITQIVELNKEILLDGSLGKGFCIGHSYFCGAQVCTEEWMKEIVNYDILPMLSEYWFDEPAKVQRWENRLHGIFQ
jgi:5-methylcytosine-specific restriction protein B